MESILNMILLTVGLLVGMLLCRALGRWAGKRHATGGGDHDEEGAGAIDGAIFALFGLMIAFTYSGASSRFDLRRAQIVTEANAIGTAYLRLDLLPSEAQRELRPLFRQYVESRLTTFRKIPDERAVVAENERGAIIQGQIWTRAVAAAQASANPAVLTLVAQSLNDMIDITTTRLATARTHVPHVTVAVVVALAFASALVVGYATAHNRRRSWFRTVIFAMAIFATVYVTLDLEYPRVGLVRIDAGDWVMEELLQQMR